jgi:hypothetical protein
MIRYQCRDCGAPLDRHPPKKRGQPATAYCDCLDAAWLLPLDGAPLKLVHHGSSRALGVLEDRAMLIPVETMPPRSDD